MFTTTFYSFKGGVGRTLALANVATALADSGKKVLVVDFDLEAPGLTSILPAEGRSRGILEYVESFQLTNIAPDVREYCYPMDIDNSGGSLWVMPASANTGAHADTLSRIDWHELYERQNGYLMVEDLKQQWEERLMVDYVFIDSRTGHTDVEGICTRQLADALVLMFFLNEQNRLGITEVSRRVRVDDDEDNKTTQLFVASNVPDLDDEHEVLANLLNRFSESLGYTQPDAIVHHYPSLRLLEEPLFVRDRPNTKLAKEYLTLTSAIRRANPADEVGVMEHLDYVLAEGPITGITDERRRRVLQQVYRHHSDKPSILFKMAVWKDGLGETSEALDVLDRVVELAPSLVGARLRRARLKAQFDDDKETARQDVLAAMRSSEADLSHLIQTVHLTVRYKLDVLDALVESPSVARLGSFELCRLLEHLSTSRSALIVARRIAEASFNDDDSADEIDLRNKLACILIGLGEFDQAQQVINDQGPPDDDEDSESELFNYATARWAATGDVPQELFLRLVEGADPPGSVPSVNYDQCIALACWAVGNMELGLEYINSALGRSQTFFRPDLSCWSYRYRHGSRMRRELECVRDLLRGSEILPLFMQRKDLFDSVEYRS